MYLFIGDICCIPSGSPFWENFLVYCQLHYAITDESDLVLLGNIAFLDPPKDSAAQAIKALKRNGVDVKIMGVGMYLPFSPIGASLGFVPLPAVYFLWLALILTCYCVLLNL
jgi:hypothetical protein